MNGLFSIRGRVDESMHGRVEIVHRRVRRRRKEVTVAAWDGERVCGWDNVRPRNCPVFNGVLERHIDKTAAAENARANNSGRKRVTHRLAAAQGGKRLRNSLTKGPRPDVNMRIDETREYGVLGEIHLLGTRRRGDVLADRGHFSVGDYHDRLRERRFFRVVDELPAPDIDHPGGGSRKRRERAKEADHGGQKYFSHHTLPRKLKVAGFATDEHDGRQPKSWGARSQISIAKLERCKAARASAAHASDVSRGLKMKMKPQLDEDFPRIQIVRPAKSKTIVQQHAPVGYVDPLHVDGQPFAKIFAYR